MKTVYLHRNNEGKVFYIGSGSKKRPFDKSNRSKEWKKAAKKGFEVELLGELNKEYALELECFIQILIGIENLSNIKIGNQNTKEISKKISKSLKGRTRSKSHCKALSKANKGRKISEELKNRLRESNKGRKPWNKGKPMKQDQKDKLREANLGKKASKESIEKRRISMIGKNAKKVINIKTNEVFISIREAAKSIKENPNNLSRKLRGERKNNTNFRYFNQC